ncbi:MAG TPA: hypothetical protein VIQ75_08075 [Gammaproteobacteria bacterium]
MANKFGAYSTDLVPGSSVYAATTIGFSGELTITWWKVAVPVGHRMVTFPAAGLKISGAWGKVRPLLPVLARFTPERPCAPSAPSPVGERTGR